MRMVKNWRQSWKWHSMQLMTIAAAFPLVWAELPADVKAYIPAGWTPWITAALLVAGIIGRLRDQGGDK